MSEYQYYEFKSIDKSLSQSEKDEVSSWSSRALVTNSSATFEYHYSDFPQDSLKVVEKYFDAMFYVANWGTRRLIFKIPQAFLDKSVKQYCAEGLEIYDSKGFILIDIWLEDDEGGGWIEGEGMLNSLITLRNDLMSGDYRCLYLVWLKVSTESVLSDHGTVDENGLEPELPNGLKDMNGALEEFIDIFGIDRDVIAAASEKSEPTLQPATVDYTNRIKQLTEEEKNKWLIRLVNNETLLSQKFKQHFRTPKAVHGKVSNRTVKEIVEASFHLKEQRKKREFLDKEEQRLEKLRKIENQESSLWRDVYSLIDQKKPKSYDEAILLLKSLKELAVYKNKYEGFKEKIRNIKEEYYSLSGLKRRIDSANLMIE